MVPLGRTRIAYESRKSSTSCEILVDTATYYEIQIRLQIAIPDGPFSTGMHLICGEGLVLLEPLGWKVSGHLPQVIWILVLSSAFLRGGLSGRSADRFERKSSLYMVDALPLRLGWG